MILFKRRNDLHKYLDAQRKSGLKTGFVPTMGALHQGHVSLIRKARDANDLTICSIFINPTQFNDPADFKKYPVTLENDIEKLEEAGCDILFLPSVEEIYPGGIHEKKQYDIGYLETILEGKYRPGHFQGVSTVVHLLLSIVQPDNLYLGQKDYQQCMVIKKLLELTGMDTITIHISPTLRENDGLAMSSRNMRLDADARKQATAIYQSLTYIKEQLKPGDLGSIKKQAVTTLSEKGFKVDYIEIADAENLFIVDKWDGKQKLVALAAAYLGNVRLIDNLLLP
jgi:pantoate--beta-alanine ligase